MSAPDNEMPDGWELRPFFDVVSIANGQVSPLVEPYRHWQLIAPDHIDTGGGELIANKTAAEQGAISGKYVVDPGDVVYSKIRPYLRKAVLAKSFALCSADMYPLRPSAETDSRFLLAAILGENFSRYASAVSMRSGFPKINREELSQYEFLMPPLPEQRKIGAILDTADEAIQKTEALIAKLKQMKAGLLHDLLTRGIDENGELRDEAVQFPLHQNIEQLPNTWEVKRLQEWCSETITYGIVQAGPHVRDGVPYIRTGDMSGDHLTIEGMLRTSPSIAKGFTRSRVQTGEIVCAIRATVGKVLEVPPELNGANLTQGTARIAPVDSINSRCLLWMLRSEGMQKQFATSVKGTTFADLTLAQLREFLVPLPKDPNEQDRVANALGAHEKRIQDESSTLRKLQKLKAGLMHDLLTGKKRVTQLESSPVQQQLTFNA